MSVFDIDLDAKKFLGTFKGSFCNDLNHDGRFELIVRDEVDSELRWYWIYSWEKGCWVDSSIQYPDYYKTTVATYLESLLGATYVRNQDLLKALIQAAKKGGPCCQ